MSIQERKQEIVNFVRERVSQADEDLQQALKDKEQAAIDMENAGTHDLRENAARASAQIAMSQAQLRIAELSARKSIGTTYVDEYVPCGFVCIGAVIELENIKTKQRYTIMIVPEGAGDSAKGAVATDSPVASAVLGKVKGDHVVVKTGSHTHTYRILNVL